MPTFQDILLILMVGFVCTGGAHSLSDPIAPYFQENYPQRARYSLTSEFFSLVVFATAVGATLSYTRIRYLQGADASKIGSVFIYILVATIGMYMNVIAIFKDPWLFLVGIVWMLIQVALLLSVAKLIKAPYFFVAIGRTANVRGAASAPVGVLLAVSGHILGTYGAGLCGILMGLVSP